MVYGVWVGACTKSQLTGRTCIPVLPVFSESNVIIIVRPADRKVFMSDACMQHTTAICGRGPTDRGASVHSCMSCHTACTGHDLTVDERRALEALATELSSSGPDVELGLLTGERVLSDVELGLLAGERVLT